MYSCGPTVYDYAHLGNFRAYIFVDLLKRYLKYSGFKVKHVMNVTDIDDKTIKGSQKKKQTLKTYTNFYLKAFLKDAKSLNILKPNILSRATEHIDEMIDLIKKLQKKDYTYNSRGSIYYKITKFNNYGRLARLDKQSLKPNAQKRLNVKDEYDKDNVNDFALWKSWSPDDKNVFWQTDLGKGRPGWHIECSAMAMKYLGETFDIHSGGVDLIFPHHTNEIAQSEAATGHKFVNYWLHNAHLIVNGQKMSKSQKNFYTLKDLNNKHCHPLLVRIILLKTHYRQTLDFNSKSLQEARAIAQKFVNFLINLDFLQEKDSKNQTKIDPLIMSTRKRFKKAMNEDLNISSALSAIYDFIGKINKQMDKLGSENAKKTKNFIFELDKILGFVESLYSQYRLVLDKKDKDLSIKELLNQREKARKDKNFKEADKIRKKLLDYNLLVEDTEFGYLLKIPKDFYGNISL